MINRIRNWVVLGIALIGVLVALIIISEGLIAVTEQKVEQPVVFETAVGVDATPTATPDPLLTPTPFPTRQPGKNG